MLLQRLITVATLLVAAAQPNYGPGYGTDLSGRPITTLAPAGTSIIVLIFLATDCPISNRYLPEIQRLHQQFAAQKVAFWEVYPNTTETPTLVRDHALAFHDTLPILLDPAQRTTSLTHANTTPQAAILSTENGTLKTLYLGRIDNRYITIDTARPRATKHDLEDAITATLTHRPIHPPSGPAIGCSIIGPQ